MRVYDIGVHGRVILDISEEADVHPTAVIGSMPESRELVAHLEKTGEWERKLSYGAWFPAVIGDGARIGPFATVDGGWKAPTRVDGWVFAHAHIGHDAIVNEGAEVSTGAVVGGHCVVGRNARVGINATMRPYSTVGEGARLGCGSVLLGHIPDGETWAGVPARRVTTASERAQETRDGVGAGAGMDAARILAERMTA